MSTTAAQEFYDHKREEHNGNYRSDCAVCRVKFEAMVAESKAKAGVA